MVSLSVLKTAVYCSLFSFMHRFKQLIIISVSEGFFFLLLTILTGFSVSQFSVSTCRNMCTSCLSASIFFFICHCFHVSFQINVSSAVLKAAAHHYGSQCDKPNKEFMLCRWEEKDPRKCLNEGRKINECALNFFR